MMKKWIGVMLVLAVVGTLIGLIVSSSSAQYIDEEIPAVISYQGYLTNPSGEPINDTLEMVFSIYQGTQSATVEWSETHPNVVVSDGLFSVILGSSGTPVGGAIFYEHSYLGIKVGADDEMTPRQRLTSVPFAFRADKARSAMALDARDGDPERAVIVDYEGDVAINQVFAYEKLDVNGAIKIGLNKDSQPGTIRWNSVENDFEGRNTTDWVSLTASGSGGGGGDADWTVNGANMYTGPSITGNVGIGTTNPLKNLHVSSQGNTEVMIEYDDASGVLSFASDSTWSGYVMKDDDSEYLGISADGTTNHLVIDQMTGDIGIGTAGPADDLEIADGTGGHLLLTRKDDVVYGGDVLGKILFESTDGGISTFDAPAMIMGAASEAHGSSNKGGLLIFSTKPDGTAENELAEERMRITSEGNVGIGVTLPEELLEVDGNIQVSGNRNGVILPDGSKLETAKPVNLKRIALLRWYDVIENQANINVEGGPWGMAFDGANIWVANSGSDSISKLDAATGEVLRTVWTGDNPRYIAFDGYFVWNTDYDNDTVTRHRAYDGFYAGQISVGANPYGIAFDGANIWVANSGDNTVTKINTSTFVKSNYPVGSYPIDVAYDGTNLWVTNNSSNTLSKLDPSSGATIDTYSVGTGPACIAFDGTNIWVTNYFSNTVSKLDPSNGSTIGTYPVGYGPFDIAFDGESIWVVNSDGGTLYRLDPYDGSVLGSYTVGDCRGIAFDGANIWISEYDNNYVRKM